LKGDIASGEIDWDRLVIPKDLAVAKFKMVDGKREEFLD
jgi:hypothetical protein